MKNNKLFPFLIISVMSLVANAVLIAMLITPQVVKFKANRQKSAQTAATVPAVTNKDNIFNEINPVDGFEIDASYGNLGPKMTAAGGIDPEKFKSIYAKSNQPLTLEQTDILQKGSAEKIKITRDNSYFLLNFFWAVGLANKSPILDEGDMMKYGGKKGPDLIEAMVVANVIMVWRF